MKFVNADLNLDVVTSYDQTKTFVAGRAQQKTIDGEDVIGPPLNKFVDVTADSVGSAPIYVGATPNGRIFHIAAETSGLARIILHEQNVATGEVSYIGQLNISLPDTAATTTTYRALRVFDSGTTGWKIMLGTTASVLINGGLFLVNNIDRADFVPIGFANIPFASGNNQKAVYFLQDPAAIGVGQLNTQTSGILLDRTNSHVYVHNGLSATHQFYKFDLSSAPSYSTSSVTGVAATDVISDSGHTFIDNDPVCFHAISGGSGLVVGTVYFVRNSVAGVSYQLSATSGGAAINFTTDIASGTVGRAFGTTGSLFIHKTGNLPVLTGVLLLTGSEEYAVPDEGLLSGEFCAFFGTVSNAYLGKLSELTSGATSWPSLQTVNYLGTTNQITAPSATHATWSDTLKRFVIAVAGPVYIVKKFVNNQIETILGGSNNTYFEGFPSNNIVQFQMAQVSAMDFHNGYLIATSTTTVGQRGAFIFDLRSNYQFDYSYAITKVMDAPGSSLSFVTTTDKLFDYTGSLLVSYRTSGFGSASGGWVEIPFAEDLSAFASGDQIQFKIQWDTAGLDTSIHAHLVDFILGYNSVNEISSNWEFGFDDSESSTPSRCAFRLKKAYASSVPTVYFRAHSLDNVLVVNHNTVTNSANFEYSTDSGLNWSSLGTIPNTVGTLLRYTFSSQPGQDIRPSLREA